MSATAVKVRGLGKLYTHRLPRYRTVVGRLRRVLEGGRSSLPVWALRDVSFDVERGECLGVTGPNGAGKSTLLGLLAGILEPTSGTVEVSGRTSTFFSPHAGQQAELSVRDNIEIAGILMGLRRRELKRREDAILDFAGLTDVAEVRLGELSSGQVARAAFSTMIHSDIDLLLVDEALSAGDRAFQDKCRSAFARLRSEGKTLIVASHDEALLRSLAARPMRLRDGRAEFPEAPGSAREASHG